MATVIVPFAVEGFGTDDEFDRRCRIQELLDEALRKTGNGLCDGGDSGSGSMNVFPQVQDVLRGVCTVLDTLRGADLLGGVIVAESSRGRRGRRTQVWWP